MRLVAVLTQDTDADVSWNWVNQAIWATVEADLAIVHAEELSYDNSTVENLGTETRAGIPLSTVKKEVPNDQEGITVHTAWNVECNQYSHSNV
ncbi:hypothetical protein N7493_006959 [Penicillium malachiteum]|uniref:Uncharacterized protein n=1 Tax=Penicillium malachiteum TaxID=1324776 RepID=A0AAD6HJP3_9EURO|nr:hypothetical protein N7493_006959 [Penicillium malachiteum]